MARKKLITLAKELGFEFNFDYYNYLIDSYINGQKSQCKKLFEAMKKADQKYFLSSWLNESDNKEIYNFYFDLL